MAKEQLHVKDRDIVVPGEVLANGMGYLPSRGTYRRGEQIISERVGLINVDGKVIKLTPLAGGYLPKVGDVIVGEVFDVLMSGWRISTNTPYSAVMPLSEGSTEFISRGADLTRYHKIGDFLMAKIVNVSSQMLIDVSVKGPGLRKLKGGRIIKVDAMKVPRIIGKKASMVQMIKDATSCRIAVGQNGVIWLSGSPEAELVAINAINQIVEKAHIAGLTDKIKAYLDKHAKKLPKVEHPPEEEYVERRRERPRFDRRERRDSRPPRDRQSRDRPRRRDEKPIRRGR